MLCMWDLIICQWRITMKDNSALRFQLLICLPQCRTGDMEFWQEHWILLQEYARKVSLKIIKWAICYFDFTFNSIIAYTVRCCVKTIILFSALLSASGWGIQKMQWHSCTVILTFHISLVLCSFVVFFLVQPLFIDLNIQLYILNNLTACNISDFRDKIYLILYAERKRQQALVLNVTFQPGKPILIPLSANWSITPILVATSDFGIS